MIVSATSRTRSNDKTKHTRAQSLRWISSIMQSGVTAPSDEPSPGGYIAADSPVLPDSVKAAFERAYEPQDGVTIRPVALLAEQVVSGHNYLILCRTTPVVEDPVSGYCFAVLYVDFDGKSQIHWLAEPVYPTVDIK